MEKEEYYKLVYKIPDGVYEEETHLTLEDAKKAADHLNSEYGITSFPIYKVTKKLLETYTPRRLEVVKVEKEEIAPVKKIEEPKIITAIVGKEEIKKGIENYLYMENFIEGIVQKAVDKYFNENSSKIMGRLNI